MPKGFHKPDALGDDTKAEVRSNMEFPVQPKNDLPFKKAEKNQSSILMAKKHNSKSIIAVCAAAFVVIVILIAVFSGKGSKNNGTTADPFDNSQQNTLDEAMPGSSDTVQNDEQSDYGPTFTDQAAKFAANAGVEIIGQIGDSCYYVVKEYSSELYGIFCADIFGYSVQPTYNDMQLVDNIGYIPAKQASYWGYIDCNGNTVINFYYSRVKPFFKGYAPVEAEGADWGVINQAGETCLNYEFARVDLTDNGIICSDSSFNTGYFDYSLYDYNFDCVVSTDPLNKNTSYSSITYGYDGFEFVGNFAFAHRDWKDGYDVFYVNGQDSRAYSNDELSAMLGIEVDDWYARILNDNRIEIICDDECCDHYYYLADSDMSILSTQSFGYIGKPNATGQMVANLGYKGNYYSSKSWVVIDDSGNIVRDLPDIDYHMWKSSYIYYTDVNDEYVSATCEYGIDHQQQYKLLNLITMEWRECGRAPEMLYGTQCIIVSDAFSGLYGIIDHGEQVLECLYNSAEYNDGVITLTRGSQQETYTPQK